MIHAIFKIVFFWLRLLFVAFFSLSLFFVVLYKFVPVYYTPLMFIRCYQQLHEGEKMKLHHKWVPIDEISQSMVQAVVASEDNLFLAHNGFDFNGIQAAAEEDLSSGKRMRGGSTISQQTAKNVFLWPGRSFVRKGLEAYFTVLIEFVWGKERIMEVYLNSIEMGDGIYGAEAVAKEHFHKHAAELTQKEAALIAASLPNPIQFDSGKPSEYMIHRRRRIMSIMDKIMKVDFGKDHSNEDQHSKKNKSIKNRVGWKV